MSNPAPTSLLTPSSSAPSTSPADQERGGGLTGNVLGGVISGVVLLVLFLAVGFIIFHFRHIAGQVIREYKERHPERFGVQPVKEKRGWWGRRRKGEGGDAKGNNKREKDVEGRGEKGTGKGGRDEKKGGKGEGDMMEKVTKKETSDHIFIPLRDEAFGASYGQEPGGGR